METQSPGISGGGVVHTQTYRPHASRLTPHPSAPLAAASGDVSWLPSSVESGSCLAGFPASHQIRVPTEPSWTPAVSSLGTVPCLQPASWSPSDISVPRTVYVVIVTHACFSGTVLFFATLHAILIFRSVHKASITTAKQTSTGTNDPQARSHWAGFSQSRTKKTWRCRDLHIHPDLCIDVRKPPLRASSWLTWLGLQRPRGPRMCTWHARDPAGRSVGSSVSLSPR